MVTLDLTDVGPVTLNSLLLAQETEGAPRGLEVLLTTDQHADVYSQLQQQVQAMPVCVSSEGIRWNAMTLRVKEA